MRQVLYLDTSVLSAYYDERESSRLALTRAFWSVLGDYRVLISELVLEELGRLSNPNARVRLQALAAPFTVVEVDDAVEELALAYLESSAFPVRYSDDARHVAAAVVNGADFLVSWNFKHMVKVRTRRLISLVNAQAGHRSIEIVAPPEL